MVGMTEWRDAFYGENGLSAAIERIYLLVERAEEYEMASPKCVIGAVWASEHAAECADRVSRLTSRLDTLRIGMADHLFDSLD